ncbi:triose-phosphate isomerase [Marinobacteraceae bacterium S3BR75-40.1]
MRRQIVAGNWKMNGSRSFSDELLGNLRQSLETLDSATEVVIMPPSILVGQVAALASGSRIKVGVQNVAAYENGAYTGEISAEMAADQGCAYVIVGHSERRQLFGESDEVVADKVERVLLQGLMPVVCVGETLDEREAGSAEAVVERQLKKGLANVELDKLASVVIAYEPVWAIGTGKTATAEQAQDMHAHIRRVLVDMGGDGSRVSLLYGGSVKPENASELFLQPDIDGGLIGGASLDAEAFTRICQAI